MRKLRKLTQKQKEEVEGLRWVAATLASKELQKKFIGNVATLEDLTQVAMLGVSCAVYDWNEKGGKSVSSYAWDRARAYIGHYMRDKSRVIKVPRTVQTLYYNYCDIKYSSHADIVQEAETRGISAITLYCELLKCTQQQLVDAMRVGYSTPFDFYGESCVDIDGENSQYTENQLDTLKLVSELLSDSDMRLCSQYYGGKKLSLKKREKAEALIGLIKDTLKTRGMYDTDLFAVE